MANKIKGIHAHVDLDLANYIKHRVNTYMSVVLTII